MDDAPRAPTKLGRYTVLARLASGGMGTVWVARVEGALGFERIVAIKTIRGDYAEDDPFRTMFIDEVRIASRIEHPNVAQVLDVGEHEGRPYVVFEWVDGASVSALARAVRKKGEEIPVAVTLRIVVDACKGLHAAHELRDESGALRNVVHRDVSPQNLLVGANGVVKLIDFGIAKARDRVSAETSASSLKGKASYMAPEQALGQTIDRRADVFGLGALTYELLSGRSPYAASNETATLHRLATGDPPPMPLPAAVPPNIAALVLRTLEREPDRRFASTFELSTAIEAADSAARALGEPSLLATTAELADYVVTHLAEPLAARKDLIEAAKKLDAGPAPAPTFEAATTVSAVSLPKAHEPRRGRWFVAAAASASALFAVVVAWREISSQGLRGPSPSQTAVSAMALPTTLPIQSSAPNAPTAPVTEVVLAADASSDVVTALRATPTAFPPSLPRRSIARPKASSPSVQSPPSHHPDYGGF